MKQKFVIDTTPLITLLLIICGNSKEENIAKNKSAKDKCEEYNEKYFSQLGLEKEGVIENIYKHIPYMTKNIIVTPNILTETYDLLDSSKYSMKGERQKEFWMSVMDFIKKNQ